MAFFARPNLDDTQFKQLDGSVLTLSGQTQIVTTSGLTLADGSGNTIVINAKGAAIGNVLTYDGNEISLSSPSSGASTGIYTCASPTTCTVGGLSACTNISGCSIGYILQQILVPTLNPTLTAPSSTFTISCLPTTSTGYYEYGTVVSVNGSSVFNRGCVNPAYCCVSGDGSDKRSGLPAYHCFNDWGTGVPIVTTLTSVPYAFTPYAINGTCQSVSARVFYQAATNNVLKSDGSCWCSPLPSGSTAAITRTLLGTMPWFYGKSTSIPITASCIPNGTKQVFPAVGTVSICFNSSPSDYLWLAVPQGTPAKTCWYVNGTNNGAISGIAGQTWAQACTVTGVTSTQGCWSGCTYSVYVTCLPTGTDPNVPMCFY